MRYCANNRCVIGWGIVVLALVVLGCALSACLSSGPRWSARSDRFALEPIAGGSQLLQWRFLSDPDNKPRQALPPVTRFSCNGGPTKFTVLTSAGNSERSAASANGRYVAVWAQDDELRQDEVLRIADTWTGAEWQADSCRSTLRRTPTFSSDGEMLAYTDDNETAHLVGTRSGTRIKSWPSAGYGYRFSPDGSHFLVYVAAGKGESGGYAMHIWDVRRQASAGMVFWCEGIEFTSDAKYLLAQRMKPESQHVDGVIVWDLRAASPYLTINTPPDTSVFMALSRDERVLAVWSVDVRHHARGLLQFWDLTTGILRAQTHIDSDQAEQGIISPNGQYFALYTMSQQIVYDTNTANVLWLATDDRPHPQWGALLFFTADSESLVTQTPDALRWRRVTTGDLVLEQAYLRRF
jgi:hypothetical protein